MPEMISSRGLLAYQHQVVLTPELHYRQCHPLHRQEPRFSILLDMGNNFEDIDILNLSTP
ncbi:MAG: hypothetical protein VX677_11550 [Candidatus Poribacteria bacterium]|nr:hypothetical protein [Candidatus Poribacteria bacterium]